MSKIITLFVFVFFAQMSFSQESMNYYLPQDITYNKNIPTPEAYFKMQMGEWHLTYDQVLSYLKELDRLSDRAILAEYARTYENRPLVHLIFSSEENMKKLEELKKLHFNFSEPGSTIEPDEVPLVVTLGYGVHGNESSATNSSVITAYYLAAAQGEKMDKLLNQTIILVDPCLNPDGFTRHSTWANMNQSITANGKPDSRQFREMWPGGRSNHYWFDLNRDYLPLVHPESRGRVENFHEWKPNIVTDHHEMDANSTFFFQPGVAKRNNPLTPEENYTLTSEIATYHARFLDKTGASYFSEEQFDDFYFGKGSSYPDVNGSVGILFEQAGFRGRIRETSNGLRKLSYGIRNQFTVTLSTLEAALNMKNKLLEYQKDFYSEALKTAKQDATKGYIFGHENDRVKTFYFAELLTRHQVDVLQITREFSVDGKTFKPGSSFFVPMQQKQYRLIKTIFETATTFADTTFYDVSTWTMPFACDVQFAKINAENKIITGEKFDSSIKPAGLVKSGENSIAFLFRWNEYSAPTALFQLQNAGLITKVAGESFSFEIEGKNEEFVPGTILIPVFDQPFSRTQIHALIKDIAVKTGIIFYGVETSLTKSGIDLGSNSFIRLNKPETLMLTGNGVNSLDAGEIWHLFDQRYKIPLCLTDGNTISTTELNRYNVIIMPGGFYPDLTGEPTQKIKSWVQAGGTLIVNTSASNWATKNDLSKIRFKKQVTPDSLQYNLYSERQKERNLNDISGAIFQADIDLTHPLCYGYQNRELPIFKEGASVAEKLNVKFAEPVTFSENPYLSGFVSDKNLDRIKNAPVVTVESFGRGKVISYHEDMVFRGFWLATNKLFINSVFFGNTIR